jgi:hypothetical protein
MRVQTNSSSPNDIAPEQPAGPVRHGGKSAAPTGTAVQPASNVSLSQKGRELSQKASSRPNAISAEPAHRIPPKQVKPNAATRTASAAVREAAGKITALQNRLLKERPSLRDEARVAIEVRLLQDYGLRLNAETTYFNVFKGGHSSHTTYNGWAHDSAPIMSMSLLDLQMRNFPADLGEDPNGLNANSGVYTRGNGAALFDTGNEVRLLSSDLKRAVRANDVGGTYRKKLKAWWNRNEKEIATLFKAQVRRWRRLGGFSPEANGMLRDIVRIAEGKTVKKPVTANVFDINSYQSKDMTWLQAASGRVVLIMPGNSRPLREYDDLDSMRKGIEEMAATASGRAELATHFSLYNRKDGTTYQGVEKWLGDIAGGGYRSRIAYAPQRIEGNIFHNKAARTREAELDDIKRLVKSNSEVIEEESTQFVRVLGQMFPEFFFPAKTTELALAIHQALTDGAATDRRQAAQNAIGTGINLAVATAIGALAAPIRRISSPGAASTAERSAYFNRPARIDGERVGYLLGPTEAPRLPSTFEEVLDEIDAANEIPDNWSEEGSLPGGRSSSSSGGSEASYDGERPPSAPPPSPMELLPGLGMPANQEGLPYLNVMNWIERLDLQHVYRAVPLESLAQRSPEVDGFVADMSLSGGDITYDDRYLFTIETQEAAMAYGNATFGAGNYAVFRIATSGVPSIPYRLNVNYDMWSASQPVIDAQAAGQQVRPDMEWLSAYVHQAPMVPADIPAGFEPLNAADMASYNGGYVFLDNRSVGAHRIYRTL